MNEIQISKLEDKIQNSEVTEAINGKSKIGLGSKAKVQNITLSQEYTFEIVGQTEADPAVGRISVGSPLGIAMAGKRHGETFKFKTPGGEHIYKVLEII
jgi:transcription elongation factor GreA